MAPRAYIQLVHIVEGRGNLKLNENIWLGSWQSVRHISKRVLCSVFFFWCFCCFFLVLFFVMWLKYNSFFFGTYFCQLKTRRAQNFFFKYHREDTFLKNLLMFCSHNWIMVKMCTIVKRSKVVLGFLLFVYLFCFVF